MQHTGTSIYASQFYITGVPYSLISCAYDTAKYFPPVEAKTMSRTQDEAKRLLFGDLHIFLKQHQAFLLRFIQESTCFITSFSDSETDETMLIFNHNHENILC